MDFAEILAAIQAAALLLNMAQQFQAAQAKGVDPMTLVPNAVATALVGAQTVTTGGANKTVQELEAAFTPITQLITGFVTLLNPPKPAA